MTQGDESFGEAVASVLSKSSAASAFVVAPVARHEEVRAALSTDGPEPRFVDVDTAVRNPGRLVTLWLDAIDEAGDAPVVAVSETVHGNRAPAALAEAHAIERLLRDVIPATVNLELTCVYDARVLEPTHVDRVWDAHDEVLEALGTGGQRLRVRPSESSPFDVPTLDAAPDDAVRVDVTQVTDLSEVRRAVLDVTEMAGLARARREDVALAANELAANSVRHGGGKGELLVWPTDGGVVVESRDAGRITDPLAGLRRPDPTRPSGRGLWIVNQVSDLVQRRNTPDGLVTRAGFAA